MDLRSPAPLARRIGLGVSIAAVLIEEAQHRIAARPGIAIRAMRPGRVAPVMVRAADAAPPLPKRGGWQAYHQSKERAPAHWARLTPNDSACQPKLRRSEGW
jgi:hypothetical protein